MKGKIIVIEGTDCSGKETQLKRLIERLEKDGKKVFSFSYPNYKTPTGKIVGGPFLGKSYICDGWFPETAPNVDALISSAYYAADRRYNRQEIIDYLNEGYLIFIDRYTYSNMAHQGGKLPTKEERMKIYKKLELLEFDIMELPKPDVVIFLYMPYEYTNKLKKSRKEVADQNEASQSHLQKAEETYLELTEIYHFNQVNCVKDNSIRTIDDIHEEVYKIVKDSIHDFEMEEKNAFRFNQ